MKVPIFSYFFVSRSIPTQAVTGTRYPTLTGFNFYYPYPKVLKISGFRVVTIYAASPQDYINVASYLAPEGRDNP